MMDLSSRVCRALLMRRERGGLRLNVGHNAKQFATGNLKKYLLPPENILRLVAVKKYRHDVVTSCFSVAWSCLLLRFVVTGRGLQRHFFCLAFSYETPEIRRSCGPRARWQRRRCAVNPAHAA